jgi:hypothetical protein
MTREHFITNLKQNTFSISIYESYYKDHSDKEWDAEAFKVWLQQSSMLSRIDVGSKLLNEKIIPYFKCKFEVVELLDKEGKFIKIVDERDIKKSN